MATITVLDANSNPVAVELPAAATVATAIQTDTDHLDINLSVLRDALRGAGSKTLTDIVTALTSVAVTVAALPLPTGAATEAGNLATIAGKDFATQTTLALVKAKTDNLDLALTALRDALRGTSSKTLTDIATALASVPITNASLSNLDITLSALRDALRGGNAKSFSDVITSLAALDPAPSATSVKTTADFTAGQTAQALWTPTSGKKFVLCDLLISCSAGGVITVFDNTDTTGNRIGKFNLAATGGAYGNYRKPLPGAAVNNVLKYTTDSTAIGSITVSGYEV